MPPEALHSPALIPPRTSSTGVTNGGAVATGSRPPVMPLISEGEWMSSSKRRLHLGTETRYDRNWSSIDWTKIHDGLWSPEKDKMLLGPYEYMLKHPGKDIRRQLITAFNSWLKVPAGSLAIITNVVAMLHTASLLIDDVEDSSILRRGVPVAHNIFGTAQTINSANYAYFLALQEVQKLNNPAVIDIYVRELLNLHRGQGMEIFWRDTLICPTEDEYLEMVANKTGGLFRLAVKLMQAESDTEHDCVPLVNIMGLIFQICDDYLNLSSTTYTKNKGLCEDLTEGKFSFPIIHSIRSDPDNLQLINILKQKTTDEQVKRYAVGYIESTGSFAHTRNVVTQLREKAFHLINEIESKQEDRGNGEMVKTILGKIVESTLKDEQDDRAS